MTAVLMVVFLFGFAQKTGYSDSGHHGETMRFNLKYGVLHIGSASITCHQDSSGCGERIVAMARSDGLLRIFRRLDYRLECCFDPVTGLPRASVINLRDRRNQQYNEISFDHSSIDDSTIVISMVSGTQILPGKIFDILTGFYHYRSNGYLDSPQTGSEVVIKTFHPDRPWDQKIRLFGEDSVRIDDVYFDCYHCKPRTVVGKFFRNDDDMSIWFTKDPSHIPVKIRLSLKIGAIYGELIEYSYIGG